MEWAATQRNHLVIVYRLNVHEEVYVFILFLNSIYCQVHECFFLLVYIFLYVLSTFFILFMHFPSSNREISFVFIWMEKKMNIGFRMMELNSIWMYKSSWWSKKIDLCSFVISSERIRLQSHTFFYRTNWFSRCIQLYLLSIWMEMKQFKWFK